MLHTCFRQGDGLAVFEVWESEEAFAVIGPMCMSIVQEVSAETRAPLLVEMIHFEMPQLRGLSPCGESDATPGGRHPGSCRRARSTS